MKQEFFKCARRKCGWVGTQEQQLWKFDPTGAKEKLVCPRCHNHTFFVAKDADIKGFKPCVVDLFIPWYRGQIKVNARQEAVLNTWKAFLGDHPSDFDDMVMTVPELLNELYQIASKPGQEDLDAAKN